jgi:hypothetical protein
MNCHDNILLIKQQPEDGNPTTGLPGGRILTYHGELSIVLMPPYKDSRTANLTVNFGETTVKRKWKKQSRNRSIKA